MKNIFFVVLMLLIFANIGYSAVTTIDGVITLDFYEDTQFGNNRWILDFKVNDVGGGVEELKFNLILWNTALNFNNTFNDSDTDYYSIGFYSSGTIPIILWPTIGSNADKLWIPVDTTFTFYTMPEEEGIPIIDTFDIRIYYANNLGNYTYEDLQLTGPVGFSAVPVTEPIGLALFAFGSFLLKVMLKQK